MASVCCECVPHVCVRVRVCFLLFLCACSCAIVGGYYVDDVEQLLTEELEEAAFEVPLEDEPLVEDPNEDDEDQVLLEEREDEDGDDDENGLDDEDQALLEEEEQSTGVEVLDDGDESILLQQSMIVQGRNTAANPKVSLFYHAWKGTDQRLAIRIISEQMINLQSAPPNSFEVYFTTVGTRWDQTLIESCGLGCSTCHHYDHYNEGWEPKTLQLLYSYCMEHPTDQVAYMHDKGSFHWLPQNDDLRRFLMKGIVSPECVNMPATCDVCSTRFSPMPHPHTPGNMWHAKCSHIRRLLPPKGFKQNMNEFAAQQPWPHPWGGGAMIGVKRYSAEHWVHSHPDTKPCDVYAGDYVANYNLDTPAKEGTWLPQLHVGIRWSLWRYTEPMWPLNPDTMTAWLQWRCSEWKTLYHKLPTNFSQWRLEEALQGSSMTMRDLGCTDEIDPEWDSPDRLWD